MVKKSFMALILLITTMSLVYGFYNDEMNADMKGTTSLITRDTSVQGHKFVFGTFEGKDLTFEAIKNNVNGGLLAMTKGEQIRLGLCNKVNCAVEDLPYEDTIMSFVEKDINDHLNNNAINAKMSTVFIPNRDELRDGGNFGLTNKYRSDTSLINYGNKDIRFQWHGLEMSYIWAGDAMMIKKSSYTILQSKGESVECYLGSTGAFDSTFYSSCIDKSCATTNTQHAYIIRPAVILDANKIAYALDVNMIANQLTEVNIADTDMLLKLRVFDSSFNKIEITNQNMSFAKGGNIELSYTNADSSKNLVVLIFSNTNQLLYYQNFGTQPNSGMITVDTKDIPIGNYQIRLVNEDISTDNQPIGVSVYNDNSALEIVDPHKIAYTKQPESGATSGKDYEYTKNVNGGQVIGRINVNPSGVLPLTYTLEANSDSTYQNLEIDGLDANNSSSSTSLNIKIKQNAQDLASGGLKAGIYKFCITAKDDNQHPTTPSLSNQTMVCETFTVDKTDLGIVFDDPNQTKKSVQDAGISTNWNETATANPFNSDLQIKYTIVSGDVGLIDLDENTGAVIYKGNGAFGKVKIRATVDDDPATGMDNYNSAYVEKEIVIYREVDGVVTPHANSTDANVPTFQANDTNVKTGGAIGTIKGTLGTPDTIGGTTTTYSYAIKSGGNGSFFTVNASSGEIKTNANLSVGTYTFTVTVSDKWSSKDIPVTVNVGMAPAEALKFYENSTSNTIINQKTVNFTDTNVSVYATVKGSSNANPVIYSLKAGEPTNVVDVNPNSGVVTIKGAGTVVIVATKQGANGQADAIAELTFTVSAGAQYFIYTTDSTLSTERPKTNGHYDALVDTYATNKTFQLYTTGNPVGSTVIYQLKNGSPSDVISVDPNGQVTILNASMNNQIGKVIVEATSHDPNGNYSDKTIELPINIEKGTRTITFAEHPINVLNGTGSVVPSILVEGVLDTEGNTTIEIDPNADSSIAWTNDGATIQYSWSEAEGKDIKIHVTKPANRNYKIAEADGSLHILGADESALTLSTPGKIIYGDHFTIRSTQDDSMSTNVQYTFETDNQVFVSVPQVNGNKAEFDAIGYSGSTEISIKVTRSADGELPLTKTVKIKVLPKPITIEIENKDRLRLEENPPLTYKDFKPQLVTWNGVKDTIDESVIKLSTSAVKYSPIGTYPIIAKNVQKQLNDNYPNYIFTIKEGLLNVKDNGDKNFWDVDDDGCPDLNIEIEDDEGNTILINGDKNEDGIPDYNIDKDGDGVPDLNIDTDQDGKPDLNLVILKEWKPSQCITLGDIQFSSGISAKAEINVDVDNDGIPDIDIDNKGDFKPHLNISKDGKTASVNITKFHDWKPGKDYKTGNFQYDSIGTDSNDPKPELNIDTDGDGRPDVNLDLDGDGTPDLNVDVDGDLIPDLNIDSTGDGKPDINVDTDHDGTPDENLMDITEWKPEHNVDQPFEYDTIKIEKQNELEDNGITVEKPDGSPFLPNIELKVTDVTVYKQAEVSEKGKELLSDRQEVKKVYDIKLLENGKEVQPDGTLKIRIPLNKGMINAILVKQNKDGTYEKLNVSIEDGYLVYESDELGIVAVIADIDSEVQGSYYPGASTGGALTGDTSNPLLYMGFTFSSLSVLCFLMYKYKRGNN